MSAKKKVGIGDLLRDEVQKVSDSSVIEVQAETVTDVVSKVPSRQALNAEKSLGAEKSPSTDDGSKAKISALESALESALAQSQKREIELSQEIADLQKDLKFSQTNVELLQKSLTAIEQLKNELDQQLVEVKRDNLSLAEANIQLSEQAKTLEAVSKPEIPHSSQLVSQSPQNNRATPRKQPVEQPYPQRDRTPYARPTGSNEKLQRINNQNIGWMD
jgi:chromosome segregation ATPase